MSCAVIWGLLLGIIAMGYAANIPLENAPTTTKITSLTTEEAPAMSMPITTEPMSDGNNKEVMGENMDKTAMGKNTNGESMQDKMDGVPAEKNEMEGEVKDAEELKDTKYLSENFLGRSSSTTDVTAMDVMKRIYSECVQMGSFACVKPKVLSFLSYATKKDKILVTDDLSIDKIRKFAPENNYVGGQGDPSMEAGEVLERIEDFLSNHELSMRLPKEITSGALLPFVPKFLVKNLPAEIKVPLSDSKHVSQERGFIKRVVVPFILGLKFKATALIPLALALIALKTWKALTLGLLSLVLSGAMVIFRFTKPKVVNYEVYHYPHAAPVVEHPVATPYEHHGYGRNFDAHNIVYSGYSRD